MLGWVKAFSLSVGLLTAVLLVTCMVMVYPIVSLALLFLALLVIMTVGFRHEVFKE